MRGDVILGTLPVDVLFSQEDGSPALVADDGEDYIILPLPVIGLS